MLQKNTPTNRRRLMSTHPLETKTNITHVSKIDFYPNDTSRIPYFLIEI